MDRPQKKKPVTKVTDFMGIELAWKA